MMPFTLSQFTFVAGSACHLLEPLHYVLLRDMPPFYRKFQRSPERIVRSFRTLLPLVSLNGRNRCKPCAPVQYVSRH